MTCLLSELLSYSCPMWQLLKFHLMTCILQCYVTTWRKSWYLGNNGTLGAKRKKVESNSATSSLSDLREVITSVCSSLKMDFLGEFWIWNKMMEVNMLCACTTAHMCEGWSAPSSSSFCPSFPASSGLSCKCYFTCVIFQIGRWVSHS